MKKLLSVIFVSVVILTSCGPAAEDRFQMDRIAKRMSDSLGNLIDSSLNDPGRNIDFAARNMAVPPQPTAAPTATTK